MNPALKLRDALNRYKKSHPELIDWRFDLHQARGLEIGLKDNQIGGPYSAPSYKRSISGEIYLIWSGQRFTSARIDNQTIEDFSTSVQLWEKTAYHDPEGVGLHTPNALPDVKTYDPSVSDIIDNTSHRPFELLHHGKDFLHQEGMNQIDGKIKCFEDHRYILNSQGANIDYLQTPVEFYFEVNHRYGKSYAEKKWPRFEEIETLLKQTAAVGLLLEKEHHKTFSGTARIIFPPEMMESFVDHFLISNLYGSHVVNRQSRFSQADFESNRQVLRSDINIFIDNLQPYRRFTYPCTAELVPGGHLELIHSGCLQTPILNLKYSKKMGLEPTPAPISGGFFLRPSGGPAPSWNEMIHQTENGLIVHSVLGLHTQDASSGHFSLTADQCLTVENGEISGRVKAVINGDFMSSLLDETASFADCSGEDNPGFFFNASASSC